MCALAFRDDPLAVVPVMPILAAAVRRQAAAGADRLFPAGGAKPHPRPMLVNVIAKLERAECLRSYFFLGIHDLPQKTYGGPGGIRTLVCGFADRRLASRTSGP